MPILLFIFLEDSLLLCNSLRNLTDLSQVKIKTINIRLTDPPFELVRTVARNLTPESYNPLIMAISATVSGIYFGTFSVVVKNFSAEVTHNTSNVSPFVISLGRIS